jgi:hypothetical protein
MKISSTSGVPGTVETIPRRKRIMIEIKGDPFYGFEFFGQGSGDDAIVQHLTCGQLMAAETAFIVRGCPYCARTHEERMHALQDEGRRQAWERRTTKEELR